jgi:hypothetical protein
LLLDNKGKLILIINCLGRLQVKLNSSQSTELVLCSSDEISYSPECINVYVGETTLELGGIEETSLIDGLLLVLLFVDKFVAEVWIGVDDDDDDDDADDDVDCDVDCDVDGGVDVCACSLT